MRYILAITSRWYRPEAAAAGRGVTIDYDPLCLAIPVAENACDRMNLPHSLSVEGAESLLMARQGWMNDTIIEIEGQLDCDLHLHGFEQDEYIVEVLEIHSLETPLQAKQLADIWRNQLIKKAEGSNEGIGEVVQVNFEDLDNENADDLWNGILEGEPFRSENYSFTALQNN